MARVIENLLQEIQPYYAVIINHFYRVILFINEKIKQTPRTFLLLSGHDAQTETTKSITSYNDSQ